MEQDKEDKLEKEEESNKIREERKRKTKLTGTLIVEKLFRNREKKCMRRKKRKIGR